MKRQLFTCAILLLSGIFLLPGKGPSEILRDSCGSGLPSKAVAQNPGPLLVTVEDFPAEGFILDIGGGGEGIIGQLKGNQVIAIDISPRELEEAPPGPLKIVMDARELKFLDETFMTATVFFTFMYIADDDHGKVFQELHRVLSPGGRLLIWDVILPENRDPKKKSALFFLTITLPEKVVKTGYGVRWPEAGRPLDHYLGLAEEFGFGITRKAVEERWFFLELTKK